MIKGDQGMKGLTEPQIIKKYRRFNIAYAVFSALSIIATLWGFKLNYSLILYGMLTALIIISPMSLFLSILVLLSRSKWRVCYEGTKEPHVHWQGKSHKERKIRDKILNKWEGVIIKDGD